MDRSIFYFITGVICFAMGLVFIGLGIHTKKTKHRLPETEWGSGFKELTTHEPEQISLNSLNWGKKTTYLSFFFYF